MFDRQRRQMCIGREGACRAEPGQEAEDVIGECSVHHVNHASHAAAMVSVAIVTGTPIQACVRQSISIP